MTRETAIEILKELWRTKYPLYLESDIRKALEMAIQSLEQEPRKDEVILTNKEYRELVSSEYENGYAKGFMDAIEQEPSGDLISRQDAIKAIDEKAKRIKNEDTLNGLAGAVGILFDLPPVKPQEKTGHWINISNKDLHDYRTGNKLCFECSECRSQYTYKSNYCPNCGMVDPQERSE